VRLRVAAVIVALVVLPAIVFAVARDHRATPAVHGWTAYPADEGLYRSTPAGLRMWAANYQKRNPGAICTVTDTHASCHGYDPATGEAISGSFTIQAQPGTS
jgi:hypothetical protein